MNFASASSMTHGQLASLCCYVRNFGLKGPISTVLPEQGPGKRLFGSVRATDWVARIIICSLGSLWERAVTVTDLTNLRQIGGHECMWESGGTNPLILKLGIRWTWEASLIPRSLYPRGEALGHPIVQVRHSAGLNSLKSRQISCTCQEWCIISLLTSRQPSHYADWAIPADIVRHCQANKKYRRNENVSW
jgi:hypothetical protein